ncbi:glycosyltransferase family 4 protein [Candidatus Margulisiibacteriota bacterium]
MKILQINSFFYDRGGDCRHMFATTALLEKHGHKVVHFAMKHPQNLNSPYAEHWPSYIDYKEALKTKNIRTALKVLWRTIYSKEAKDCLSKLLDTEKPDIVHIHNILHHLSPSILGEIKKRGIPLVWTLHDYTIICPNTHLLTDKGVICQSCKKRNFFMAPLKKCKKNSLAASFMAMLENYTHRLLNVYRHVDQFIAPSEFLRQKFLEFGMGRKVFVLPNFIETDNLDPAYSSQGYYLYFGRLSHIKGISTLIDAARLNPDIPLKVAGDGELLKELRAENIPNVDFLGFQDQDKLKKLIAGAMFVVVPSEWYENFPYAVLESMAYGKPVIGADIGGIPEQIEHGIDGYLFEPRDSEQLAVYIKLLTGNHELRLSMGQEARKKIETLYSADLHYELLMSLYQRQLKQ